VMPIRAAASASDPERANSRRKNVCRRARVGRFGGGASGPSAAAGKIAIGGSGAGSGVAARRACPAGLEALDMFDSSSPAHVAD
jgi:hypothetical protein